ncbi:MAG: hypothetical protein R6V03_00030 [Kiritimatiellia bacterium]
MKRSHFISSIAIAALAAVTVFLHFHDLQSDPPAGISTSAGAYFDGFSNAHAARSCVLHGEMRPDEWDPFVYSPPYVLAQIPWFKLNGTGIAAVKSFSALLSLGALFAAVSCFRRSGKETMLIALLLFSLSYMYLQFGRLGLFETMMIFFMLCAVSCMASPPLSRMQAFGAGAFAMLAFATKAISVYFLPAVAAGFLMEALRSREKTGGIRSSLLSPALGVAGAAAVFFPWLLFFRIPNRDAIARIGSMWKEMTFPDSIGRALKEAVSTPALGSIGAYDSIWVLAVITAAVVVYLCLVRPSSAEPWVTATAVWFICGVAMTSVLTYEATRYFYPLLPPALCLSAYAMGKFIKTETLQLRPKSPWADILALGAATVLFRFYLMPRVDIAEIMLPAVSPAWRKIAAAFGAAVVTWITARLVLTAIKRPVRIPTGVRYSVVILLCLYFAVKNGDNVLRWLRHPHNYTIAEAGRSLRKYPRMVVGGTSALAAVIETDHTAVRIGKPGWYNYRDPFSKYGITHLFITDYAGEVGRYRKLYPEIMAGARRIDKMNICGYPFRLFELNPENNNSRE